MTTEYDIRRERDIIRQRYMDKYDGGPPFHGNQGFTANIDYLEAELIRVRLILRKIESETCVMGSDSGHSGVEKLAKEGLAIPV